MRSRCILVTQKDYLSSCPHRLCLSLVLYNDFLLSKLIVNSSLLSDQHKSNDFWWLFISLPKIKVELAWGLFCCPHKVPNTPVIKGFSYKPSAGESGVDESLQTGVINCDTGHEPKIHTLLRGKIPGKLPYIYIMFDPPQNGHSNSFTQPFAKNPIQFLHHPYVPRRNRPVSCHVGARTSSTVPVWQLGFPSHGQLRGSNGYSNKSNLPFLTMWYGFFGWGGFVG